MRVSSPEPLCEDANDVNAVDDAQTCDVLLSGCNAWHDATHGWTSALSHHMACDISPRHYYTAKHHPHCTKKVSKTLLHCKTQSPMHQKSLSSHEYTAKPNPQCTKKVSKTLLHWQTQSLIHKKGLQDITTLQKTVPSRPKTNPPGIEPRTFG